MKINLEEARKIQKAQGKFCQDCGETNPKSGFYPMFISWRTDKEASLSSHLCNDCEKKRRNP